MGRLSLTYLDVVTMARTPYPNPNLAGAPAGDALADELARAQQTTKVIENVQAGKDAADAVKFFSDFGQPLHFWVVLAELVEQQLALHRPPPPIEIDIRGLDQFPFNELQARNFESVSGPSYGRYANQLVRDIPGNYLEWLAEGDTFTKELHRYIASKWYQTREERHAEPT